VTVDPGGNLETALLEPRFVTIVGDALVEWTRLGLCGVERNVERNRVGDSG